MTKDCYIVADLMPLYDEDLLSEETTEWLKKHVNECENCQQLLENTEEKLDKTTIESPISNEEMFKKINRKLANFQLIFVGISFVFAMITSLLNNSFHFILTYAILGAVTYLFYKDVKIVFVISFLPIFLWEIAIYIQEYINGLMATDQSFWELSFLLISGAAFMAAIHLVFALLGALCAFLFLKVRGDENDEKNRL